jgi:hypothetical protein
MLSLNIWVKQSAFQANKVVNQLTAYRKTWYWENFEIGLRHYSDFPQTLCQALLDLAKLSNDALAYVKISNLARWCGKQVHVNVKCIPSVSSAVITGRKKAGRQSLAFCYKKKHKILILTMREFIDLIFFVENAQKLQQTLTRQYWWQSQYHAEINLFIKGNERYISEILAATRLFSTTPESAVTMPTLPDIGNLRKFKMADWKQEVGPSITFERKEIATVARLQRLR